MKKDFIIQKLETAGFIRKVRMPGLFQKRHGAQQFKYFHEKSGLSAIISLDKFGQVRGKRTREMLFNLIRRVEQTA